MKTPKKQKAEDAGKIKEVLDKTATNRRIGQQVPRHHQGRGDRERTPEELLAFPSTTRCPADCSRHFAAGQDQAAKAKATFTHAEVAGMIQAVLEAAQGSDGQQRAAFLLVAKHLLERSLEETTGLATKAAAKSKEPKAKIPAGTVFQFKITLAGHRTSDLAANPDQGMHLGQAA